MVKRVHSRGRHMEKERKFEKHRGSLKRIQKEDDYGD